MHLRAADFFCHRHALLLCQRSLRLSGALSVEGRMTVLFVIFCSARKETDSEQCDALVLCVLLRVSNKMFFDETVAWRCLRSQHLLPVSNFNDSRGRHDKRSCRQYNA